MMALSPLPTALQSTTQFSGYFVGSVKPSQLEEAQEKRNNEELASKLGIYYDELCELSWDFDTNESKDGLVYSHIMVIEQEGAPQEILDKIEGLEDGKYVYFQPGEFETEEPV